MTYPDLSPKAWAVLRDLEDTERHRRCEAETWLYVADDRFECSVCGVIRTSVRYTRDARVELDNLESRGGPSSVLNPLEAGRFASSRLRR